MKTIQGGAVAANGFRAASCAAGIKKNGTTDMAMLFSIVPCITAGTFTTNIVKAAPVLWDRNIVQGSGKAQAVVINSGVANACTGTEGYESCRKTAQAAGEALQIPEDAVFVASTGVIGQQIPTDRILDGVRQMAPQLLDAAKTGRSGPDASGTEKITGEALSAIREAGAAAAKAIMTTDTVPKEAAVSAEIGGKAVTIGGMCKGSGMIHPNMCTMLCFITTDAVITKPLLQKALSGAVQDTFNMVSIDGDTSTNDTVLLMANGLAGNDEISSEGEDYEIFCSALREVCTVLAKKIASDGEGATKLFETRVLHAENKEQAVTLSKAVISSNLTKAAIFGSDANWGRILCAMGYSGAAFDPECVDLWFESAAGRIQILENGSALPFSEETASKILSEEEVRAIVDLHQGEAEAVAWGCDLTYDYVKINADYRS